MQREYKISLSQEFYSDVVYLSQYDEDYPLIFTVFDKHAKANSINGCTAELTGLRPDGMGFTYTSTAVGHTVSFTIDAMLTGLSGAHTAEIIFYKDTTKRMGTANIRIVVEPAARPDGTIDGDVERCEEIAAEVQEIVDTAAATVKGEAEAWAVGQRDGVDVPSTDPAYENNAKYYAQQAAQTAEDISGVTDQVAQNTSDIGDLKEDLKSDILETFKAPIIYGGLISSEYWITGDGISPVDGSVVRRNEYGSSTYVPIQKATLFYIDNPTYVFNCWEYSQAGYLSATYSPKSAYDNTPIILTLKNNSAYFRIGVKRVDNTNITSEDISAIIASIKTYTLTDTTLTLPGVPADAKATRDEIGALKEDLRGYLRGYQESTFRSPISYNITSNTWTIGQGVNPTTGANMPNAKYARTNYIRFSKPTLLYFDNSDYDFIVWEYSTQSVDNAEFAPRGYYGDEPVIISVEQGVTDFRVGVKRKDNADISAADITVLVAKLKTFILTDNTLTLSNVPADAKKTGDEIASIISKTVITPNAKMLSVGNSILTGSVWVEGSFDHLVSYSNSPYGNIANALNIAQSNETHMHFDSTGLMYDAGNGSFLDNILETDISEYDYILTHLSGMDLSSTVSSSIGSLNSTAGDGTVAGAVLTLLAYIKTNNPDCRLILVGVPPTGINGADRGENEFTFGYENGANIIECDYLMHQLAEQEHFTFADWEDFEPSYRWKDFTDSLNIHLNNENTYRKAGEYLGNQITAQQEQGTFNRAVAKCCNITWKSSTYINADGGEGSDSNIKASNFIPVIPGETICMQHVLRISSNLIYLTCYDITKNKITDARDSTGSAGTVIRSIVEYTVPASGAYIRVSALASEDICHVWHAREFYMPNPQIGLLGDKISQAQDEIEHLMAFDTNIALNTYNVLYKLTGDNRTHNGVTFTWNESAGTVKLYSESPSTGTAFSNLFYNAAHFPDGIVAGGKYKLLVRGAVNGAIRIGYLTSGNTIDAFSCTEDTILTIPAHATGMYIRASVESGVTINETISYALPNTATNKELADVAQYGTKDALCGIVVDDSTRDGLTFTFGNGTVTVDGTASASTILPLIGGATTIPDRLMELSGKVIYVDYQTSTPLILRIYGIKNGVWTKLIETDKVMEYVMPDLSVYDGVQVRFYCYVGSIFDNDVIAMPKIFSSTDYKFLQQRFNYGYKEPMITIIDDDGDVHFKYDLLPLIQELNVPIASAVTTTRIAESEAAQPGDYATRWMTWEQIRDCAKGGAEIVCHMYSHPTPEQVEVMSQEEIVHNLYMAKNYLKINGVSSDVLVYSNSTGLASNKLRSVAGRVFNCGFRTGTDATLIYPDTDRYSLPRYGIDYDYDYDLDDMKTIIDMVAANGGWCVWMIHTSASHAAPGHWRAILDNEGNMTGEDDTDGTGNYVGKVKNVPALKSAIQYALQNGVKIVTAEYGLQKYFAETGNLH